MAEQQYQEVLQTVNESKTRKSTKSALYDVLPFIILVFYPMQLLFLLFKDGFYKGIASEQFLKFAIIPCGLLLILSIVKLLFGERVSNFPSVSVAFSSIIGMGFLFLNTALGIIMLLFSIVTSISKITVESNKVGEIISGNLLGIILGLLFFLI